MKNVFAFSVCIALCVMITLLTGAHGQNPDPGPPQFLTRPISLHVGEAGLEHGQFVFDNEAAIPAPLAPNLGAANYLAPQFDAAALSGSEFDMSDGSDLYEGETSAAGTGVLVGSSNHIYPGNCSASAPQNGFGDCAVMAYTLNSSGTVISRTTISRTRSGTTFSITFDPAVDYDKTGNFFFSFGGASLNKNYPNSIGVSKSSDGTNWSTPVAVTFNQGNNFDDKYYIAVDRSNSAFSNRIYVSWNRNSANNQILYISYSACGGASWSVPIKVNYGTTKF